MNIRLQAPLPQLQDLGHRLQEFERLMGSPEPLLKQLGGVMLREIDQNFAKGGYPKWAPLTPWTLAGRRQGNGKGGALPLQDTGALRRSFPSQGC